MGKILLLISAVCLLCSGCSDGDSDGKSLIIMSWNVQNLFDDVDNGTEYREFDPGNGDWTYDSFSRKADALADVITSSVQGGPDILLLQEVENDNALRHLNDESLKSSGYRFRLFLPTENSAVGVAVLSRYPISDANSHAVYCGREIRGRNIAELHLIPDEAAGELVIFINHWKSKLGGAEETEAYRIAASVLLCRLMREAGELYPDAMIMAAGDFNESHDEFRRVEGSYQTAIICGQTAAYGAPVLHCITIEELILNTAAGFFNPWTESELKGSYFYDGSWQTIDQFFLNKAFFDNRGWEYADFSVTALDFNTTEEGLPLRWQTASGYGCSDHFPIILELKRVE